MPSEAGNLHWRSGQFPHFLQHSCGCCAQNSLGTLKAIRLAEKNSTGKTHLERMPKSTKTNRPIRENAQTKSPLRALLKRPSTWLVTLFMGLQSAAFYTFCNWLPSIAGTAGFSSSEAGVHLFIFQALGIVSGLLIPRFMYLRGNQVRARAPGKCAAVSRRIGMAPEPASFPSLEHFWGNRARGFAGGGAHPYLSARKNPRRNSSPFGFCPIAWLSSCRMRTLCIWRTYGNNAGVRSTLGIYDSPRHSSMCAVVFRGANSQRSVTSTRFFAAKHRICRTAQDQLISYRTNQNRRHHRPPSTVEQKAITSINRLAASLKKGKRKAAPTLQQIESSHRRKRFDATIEGGLRCSDASA